jgi:xanthine dehydrogenase accessory factor
MNIYDAIVQYLESGRQGRLATVIGRAGSAPREAGAKMFVGEDGRIFGTIGGGRLESEAHARAVADMGAPGTTVFRISAPERQREAVCGGNAEVLIEPVGAGHLHLYRRIRDAVWSRALGVVVTRFAPREFAKSFVAGETLAAGDPLEAPILDWALESLAGGRPVVSDGIVADPLHGRVPLYLFGAGHVARFVATIATIADFAVTVVDDRADFANRDRFPDVETIVTMPHADAFERLPFTGEEYVVILTSSHAQDAEILEESLRRPLRYVGMIGSRRKIGSIIDRLRGLGFGEETIGRIHAPIGISIGAQTPQEIAIAIAAELVAVRSGEADTAGAARG